jgi:hypothetical protein
LTIFFGISGELAEVQVDGSESILTMKLARVVVEQRESPTEKKTIKKKTR